MSTQVSSPNQIPTETSQLPPDEETLFNRIFERNFVFENLQREFDNILRRHKDEIETGATVMRAQAGKPFQGTQPTSDGFGMFLTRAPYFGLKSWRLDNSAYGGAASTTLINGNAAAAGVNAWLNKKLLTGTSGDDTANLIVGKYAVHVICAIADFSSAPVIESFQETTGPGTQPVFPVEHQFRNSNLKYAEFDLAYLYKQDSQFLWQYNADTAGGNPPYEEPYFFGVSFLPYTQSKILDPTKFNGGTTVESVIHG